MDYNSRRRSRIARARTAYGTSRILTYNKLLRFAFFALIAIVIAIPILFIWYSRDLPTPGKLVTSKYKDATRIYDRKGTLLYSVFQDQNRTYKKLPDIPKNLQEATISIEDKNFYTNNGFSPISYLRVARDALLGHGLSGGSTITQQLVKNVLLSNERSLSRKIKELILAIQVNQKYSKDEILEMYLNNIPYGGTAIGVEAASQQYFGKSVKDLDLGQSAFLAGLPQSPSVYAPFTGGKAYITRTQEVLTQMVANNYITQSQANDALNEIKNYQFTQQDQDIKAPHFVMYVRQILEQQFGSQAVATGGLQVTTSLDYDIEKHAEQIVNSQVKGLKAYDVSNGAAIVEDPKTGEILAMVGSEDYFDKNNDGNFNVATSQTRQPGSSLKPIMYATAFEHGYTPSTMIMDVKTDFPTNDSTSSMYTPVNYDGKFHGTVQIRFALANSFNVPAVKMLARVGIKPVMQQAYDMGISNWNPTPQNLSSVGLSLILGGRETSLLDEVKAYGVFANQGIKQDQVSILKVADGKGNVLYQYKPTQGSQVLPANVSFLISHILSDNNARTLEFGPYSSLLIPGKTVSVKTGTTDEKRDNWTVGYTPSYVVGVWVGNNNNAPMSPTLASGITGAAPIWNSIMKYILKDKKDEPVQKPDDVTALQIDAFAGGLPHGGQPTRAEYFIKGTEPTAESPIYKSKDGQEYYVFHEDDPVSKDGVNRWQKGIDDWIQQNHKDDKMWNPPDDLKNPKDAGSSNTPTPTAAVNGAATTPIPTQTSTPSPTP